MSGISPLVSNERAPKPKPLRWCWRPWYLPWWLWKRLPHRVNWWLSYKRGKC